MLAEYLREKSHQVSSDNRDLDMSVLGLPPQETLQLVFLF